MGPCIIRVLKPSLDQHTNECEENSIKEAGDSLLHDHIELATSKDYDPSTFHNY